MFDATLLDSSPARTPILTLQHWVAALFVATAGAAAGYFLLPHLMVATPASRMAESLALGLGLMVYELMLLYVLADARRLGLSAAKWSVALLVLNIVGFVAYLIYAAIKTGDWKRAALPVAYIMETLVICGLVILPLIRTEGLPNIRWNSAGTLAPPPPPGPSPAQAPRARAAIHASPAPPSTITAPMVIPKRIAMVKDEPVERPAISMGPGVPGGVPYTVVRDILEKSDVPPPPQPAKRAAPPLRVNSGIEQAKLVYGPRPEYPPLAVMSRIEGVVQLEAIIGKDGTIQNLKVLSGHPLLVRAAVNAVLRWRYLPTLLNGEPVEVLTEIEVRFTLGEI